MRELIILNSFISKPLFRKYNVMNFKDLILGVAIGDAFGAGVEFQDRNWIKKNVDFSKFVNARHLIQTDLPDTSIFTKNYRAWDYTDDTEMTIGVIKALLSRKKFTPHLLIDFWKKEYWADAEAKGFERNGHGSMRWVFSGEKNIEEVRAFQSQRKYPGNAPPMRAVPFGFLSENLINEYAIINADATHPHPKARAASVAVARATHFLLVQNKIANNVIPYCVAHLKNMDEDFITLLLQVDKLPPPENLREEDYKILCGPQPILTPHFPEGLNGLPSDAMLTGGAVLYILKHSKSAMEGLRNSVYLGGDVDSAASICTGILGGKYGLDSIPDFMKTNVEGREKLEQLAEEFNIFCNI